MTSPDITQITDGLLYRHYIKEKYGGKIIHDDILNKEIKVADIDDLRFDDLDLEDQRLALHPNIGWAWGISDHPDINKAKKFKGYLFRPKQRSFWWAKEQSPAYIGAFGSGKSLILCLKAIYYSLLYPGTKGLLMRATYPQLLDTTVSTMFKIFSYFGWKSGVQYNHHVSRKMIELYTGKDTISTILYRPAKNEGMTVQEAIEDLQSLEIDWAGIDEVIGVEELITLAVGNRVGRWGKITRPEHRQLLVVGNPPSEGDWVHKRWYKKTFPDDTPLEDANHHTVFVSSTYENRRNLPNDYIARLEARPEYYKRSFLYGQLGYIPPDGEPVYGKFNYDIYVSDKPLTYNPKLPLLRGWDIGPTAKNKAVIWAQMDPKGVLLVLAETMKLDPGITLFGRHVVETTNILFPDCLNIKDFADPVAFHISQTDGLSAADRLLELGVALYPGEEGLQARIDAVESIMGRLIDNEVPGMRIDGTRCRKLVEGFMGGYRYKIIDMPNERFSREPLKDMYSHCLHPDTKISTPTGERRIADIRIGNRVCSQNGEQKVIAIMNQDYKGRIIEIELDNGRILTCTANHPIYTQRGIVRADALCYNDILWDDQKNTSHKSLMESNIIENHKDTTSPITTSMAGNMRTEPYGNIIMDQYQKVSTFIISTAIKATTILRILPVFHLPSISSIIFTNDILTIQSPICEVSLLRKKPPKFGMVPMKGGHGIRNTERSLGSIESNLYSNVAYATQTIKHTFKDLARDFALLIANKKQENYQAKTTLQDSVQFVKPNIQLTNMPVRKPAVKIVGLKARNGHLRVYDLTIANDHNFFAEGVLVGNCHDALQYLCSRLYYVDTKRHKDYQDKINRRNPQLLDKRRRLMGGMVR